MANVSGQCNAENSRLPRCDVCFLSVCDCYRLGLLMVRSAISSNPLPYRFAWEWPFIIGFMFEVMYRGYSYTGSIHIHRSTQY
jgi:hypothetical protein